MVKSQEGLHGVSLVLFAEFRAEKAQFVHLSFSQRSRRFARFGAYRCLLWIWSQERLVVSLPARYSLFFPRPYLSLLLRLTKPLFFFHSLLRRRHWNFHCSNEMFIWIHRRLLQVYEGEVLSRRRKPVDESREVARGRSWKFESRYLVQTE